MAMDTMIAIQPEIVTGIRIIDDTPNAVTDGASEFIGSAGPATAKPQAIHTSVERPISRLVDWCAADK